MRRWVWLLGVLVLLGGAHYAVWQVATGRLRDGYESWAAAERAAGLTIDSGRPAAGGWPLAATLSLPEVFASGAPPAFPAEFSWSTDQLVLRIGLLQPRVLQVLSTGLQRLRLSDGTEIPYTADRLQIDIPLAADGSAGLADLLANELRIGVPVAPVAPETAAGEPLAGLTVGLLTGHLGRRPAADGASPLGFLLAAEAIGLPPRGWPEVTDALGTRVSSLSVAGVLAGPLFGAADPAARARAWRTAGGALRIDRAALGWGPLGLSLTASLGLDTELQPIGTGSAHIIGFARALDALAASHAIGAHAALAGKALLGLIAQPAGAADAVDLPLALANRTLSLHDVPLLRLPALDWD